MMPLEIERKWLVERPEMDGFQWTPNLITQAYLSTSGVETVHRIRQVVAKNNTKYYYTVKSHRRAGINIEQEQEISEEIFDWMFKTRLDQSRDVLNKIRYVFEYGGHRFELDEFPEQNLIILECELEDIDEPISLPPFITILKEVTKDSQYANYNLARKTNDSPSKQDSGLLVPNRD
jgi:adenylate cyclase